MNYSPTSIADEARKAKHVYIIGNGGSYANAVHICNDLLGCGIKAYVLDPATLTASANDFGYETVFARWLTVVGEEGDLLIALSGSGKSKNILEGIHAATKRKMKHILVTDYLKSMNMQESEEEQVRLGHDVTRILRDAG